MGGAAPAVLNAANEVAVDSFLENKIKFTGIPRLNRLCLEKKGHIKAVDFIELIEIDREVRKLAEQLVDAGI
jgi:1-deoxy-D-xylulose-5-phosphate reductoisomerase